MEKKRGEDYFEQKSIAYIEKRMRFKYWVIVVAVLSALVGGGVYISLRFYGQAKTNVDRIYACTEEIHVHTDDCYIDGVLTCGYADYVIHTHNDDCYNEEGELICELPEIEEHVHTDACYEEVKVLVCGLEEGEAVSVDEKPEEESSQETNETASETEESNFEKSTKEASDEKNSDEENSDEGNSDDEASKNEDADNENSEASKETKTTGHVHTDECYKTEKVLICDIPTLHTHDESCYSSAGTLICRQLELKAHTHTKNCFEYEDVAKTRDVSTTYYAKTEHVVVTATVPESANLPEEAYLKVREISAEEDEEEFQEYLEKMREDSSFDNSDITYLLDIGFYVDDEEIEPEDEVEIIIESVEDDVEIQENASIIHFDENKETKVIDNTEVEDGKLKFESSSFSVYAVVSNTTRTEVKELESVKNSFKLTEYYDSSLMLDVAGNFHVVAFNTATVNAHCGGNILAYNLNQTNNFANTAWTDDSSGREPKASYVQNNIVTSGVTSGGGNGDLFVAGSSNKLVLNDRYYIESADNNKFILDGFTYAAVEDNTESAPFVDLTELKQDVKKISDELRTHADSNVEMTKDGDQRFYVTISDTTKEAYLNLKASDINYGNYFKISGLNDDGAYIVVNVDCENKSEVYMSTKLYSAYGTGSHSQAASSRVLWNFYNCDGSTIYFNKEVVNGTVIALGATVNITAQLNGGVIAENVTIANAQSHYYPFTGGSTSISVTKKWANLAYTSDYTVEVELYKTTNESYLKDIDKMNPTGLTATLSEDNNWTYTFSKLDSKDSEDNKLYYCVFEMAVYKNKEDITNTFESAICLSGTTETITNTRNGLAAYITASKTLNGNIPEDDEIFDFDLYKWNGSAWEKITNLVNKNGTISYELDLTDWDVNTTGYYVLKEDSSESASHYDKRYSYDTSVYLYEVQKIDCNGTTIKNVNVYKLRDTDFENNINSCSAFSNLDSYADESDAQFANKIATTEISVEKIWQDKDGNTSNKYPNSITLTLYRAKDESGTNPDTLESVKITKEDNNDWKYTFSNLDCYDADGNQYYYYVEETDVTEGDNTVKGRYDVTTDTTKYIKDGTIKITNKEKTVGEMIDITVKKNWVGIDGKEPSNVSTDAIEFELWQICESATTIESNSESKEVQFQICSFKNGDNTQKYSWTETLNCNLGDTVTITLSFNCISSPYYTEDDILNTLKNKFASNSNITVTLENSVITIVTNVLIDEKIMTLRWIDGVQRRFYQWDGIWDLDWRIDQYNPCYKSITKSSSITETATNPTTTTLYGTYKVEKSKGWSNTITDLLLTSTEGNTTYKYSYYIKEVIPDGAGYKLLNYTYNGETYDAKTDDDDLPLITSDEETTYTIVNKITTTDISIHKRWYDTDGNQLSEKASPENNITVELYRTTNSGNDDATLVGTYYLAMDSINKSEDAIGKCSRIKYANYDTEYGWAFNISELPAFDGNGNPYYYYAVETKVGETNAGESVYEVDYGYGNDELVSEHSIPINSGDIYINNRNTPTYDFLPSTGGSGTILYKINKWINELFNR